MFIGIDEQSRDLVLRDRGMVLGDFLDGAARFELLYNLLRGDARTFTSGTPPCFPATISTRSQFCQSTKAALTRPSSTSCILPHLAMEKLAVLQMTQSVRRRERDRLLVRRRASLKNLLDRWPWTSTLVTNRRGPAICFGLGDLFIRSPTPIGLGQTCSRPTLSCWFSWAFYCAPFRWAAICRSCFFSSADGSVLTLLA